MSADKRKFDNFEEFPGKINSDTDYYEFPSLFSKDKLEHTRVWSIYIRLIKKDSKKSHKKINWNLTLENQIPIKNIYLKENIPDGIIAQVWTESGILNSNITRQLPSYPLEKNKSKSNYRDFFKSALILARSKYIKKLDDGALPDNEFKSPHIEKYPKYFPMLAKKYDDFIKKNKLIYPLYIQPKLDGIRCISYLDPKIDSKKIDWENVILYSRKKKEFPINTFTIKIRKILFNILNKYYNKNENIYLDGELYNHNLHLQEINSETRTENLDNKDILENKKNPLQYHIYDIFNPIKNLTFSERLKILLEIKNNENLNNIIKIVDTTLIKNENELNKLYKKYISSNYEGIMIRFSDGIYATSNKNSGGLRSKNLLKKKEVFTDEFEVVDYTEGEKGIADNTLIWICINNEGKKFKVTPKGSFADRRKLLKECKTKFKDKYANRMLTVEYRGLSEDNIPQHSIGIEFREYE
jgi:hypothetical protein